MALPTTTAATPPFAGAPVRVPAVEPVHRVAEQDVAETKGRVVPVRNAADEEVTLGQAMQEEAVAARRAAAVVLGAAGVAAVLEGVAAGHEVAGVRRQGPAPAEAWLRAPLLLVLGAGAATVTVVASRARAAARVVDADGVAAEVVAVLGAPVTVAAVHLQVVPEGDLEAGGAACAAPGRGAKVRQDPRPLVEGVGAEGP